MSSILIRSATGCRPWRPRRLQIFRTAFDSPVPCQCEVGGYVSRLRSDHGDGRGRPLVAPAKQPSRSVTEHFHSILSISTPCWLVLGGISPWYGLRDSSTLSASSGGRESTCSGGVSSDGLNAGISLGEKPAFQAVPAEFESRCPLWPRAKPETLPRQKVGRVARGAMRSRPTGEAKICQVFIGGSDSR